MRDSRLRESRESFVYTISAPELSSCDTMHDSGDVEIHSSELLIDAIRVVNLLEYLLECDA